MTKLNDLELLAYSKEHLFYEISMLVSISRLDITIVPDQLKVLVNNLAVESFAVHLRSLIDFFYSPEYKHNTDVYAEDFFSDQNKWTSIRPPLSIALITARKRADKEVKHITIERVAGSTDSRKIWKIGELISEIVILFEVFIENASNNKLDKKILLECIHPNKKSK